MSQTTIVGEVNRVLFRNEENGYQIVSICPDSDVLSSVIVSLNHYKIHEGITMEFKGNWVVHEKYGNQFKAIDAWEVPPSTKEGLIAFLSSSFFDGIGPVKARKIVNFFGDDTYSVIDKTPERLIEVKSISQKIVDKIKVSWEKNKEIKDIMIFLRGYGISASLAVKIYEEYKRDCVNQLRENPYDLIYKIKGVGFLSADKIAMDLGFDKTHELRIRACIIYILSQSGNDGHTYLTSHQIATKANEFLGSGLNEQISFIIDKLEKSEEIFSYKKDNEDVYFSKRLWFDENYVADKLAVLKRNAEKIHIGEDFYKELASNKVILSEEQEKSIEAILSSGVSVLTGGPGTGKSFTTKSIIEALGFIGKKYLLAAPTGKAAKRIREITGEDAKTIHRLLGWDPINAGFSHNEDNPLDADFIVIDETSMVDISLAADLLRAVKNNTKVLFVGDIDQLPPVGPGSFFKDMIESGEINTIRLTKVYRQGKGSEIITFSHKINNGEIPDIESPLESPQIWKEGVECLFIDSGFAPENAERSSFPKWNSLRYGLNMVEMVEKVYVETIKKFHKDAEDIQILIPMKIGSIGTIEINKRIQQKVNPQKKGKFEIKIGDNIFRTGDKVIQTSNNYDLNVFNGDVGKIIAINNESGEVHIKYDENFIAVYPKKNLDEIELAYAITIHKSQGSEFDFVILPICNSYYRMLFRNLVYTGLTRAKKLAVFIGERKSLKFATQNINYKPRQTALKSFINGEIFC